MALNYKVLINNIIITKLKNIYTSDNFTDFLYTD